MVPEDESYKANLSFLGFTGDFPFHFVPQSHIHRRSLRMRDQLVQLEYPNDDLPHVLDFTQGMIEVMMSKGEIAVFSGDLWHAGGGCRGTIYYYLKANIKNPFCLWDNRLICVTVLEPLK